MEEKRPSIYQRILLFQFISIILIMFAYGLISYRINLSREIRLMAEETGRVAQRLSLQLPFPVWNLDRTSVNNMLVQEVKNPYLSGIAVFQRGTVWTGLRVKDTGQIDSIDTGDPTLYHDGEASKEKIVYKDGKGKVWELGELVLYTTDKTIKASLRSLLLQTALQTFLLIITLSISITIILNLLLRNPLQRITRTARRIGDGEIELQAETAGTREIATLANAFNTMTLRLRESLNELEMFRYTIDHAPDGVFWMDRKGRFTYVNEQACHSLGYSREELEKLYLWDIDPVYPKENHFEDWKKFLKGTPIINQQVETLHKRKDGTFFPIDVTSRQMWFDDTPLHVAFVRDITERKRMEQALRESEERLDLALEGANEGIWDWHLVQDTVYFDSRYYTLAGYQPDEFPGGYEEWEKRIHPDDLENVKAVVAQYLAGDLDTYQTEFRFLRKDGGYMWIQGKGKIVERDDRGNPVRFVGTHADITQLKQAQKELEMFRFTIDHAPDAVFWLDRGGRFTYVNEQACHSLGYTRGELEHLYLWDIDPVYPQKKHFEDWEQFQKGMPVETRQVETLHKRKDGTLIPIDVMSRQMWFDDTPLHVAFVRDITERKRTEESLRITQFSFDHASMGIYRIAADARILEVNHRAAEMIGYSREELAAMTLMDIDPWVTDESWGSIWQQLLDQGIDRFETTHYRKDGGVVPMEIHSNLLEYEGQQFSICFVQDISERKEMEQTLRESEERFRTLHEASFGGIFIHDQGIILECNQGLSEITGYSRDEIIGMERVNSFVAPDDRETVLEHFRLGSEESYEARGVRKDGTIYPIYIQGKEIPYRGRTVHAVEFRDITELKQAEEELRHLRNYLSNIIDSMPSVLVGVDSKGAVTQWNRRAEQVTGIRSETARFQPLDKMFPSLTHEMDRIQTSIRERRVISAPKVYRKHEQETRYEDVTIYPLVANGVEGAVIRLDDVTERVRLEEMMIQNEKMLSVGGLAAGMAHEINNPLAGIVQSASVLENRLLGDLPANQKAANAAGITLAAMRQYITLRKLPGLMANIRESGSRAAAIVKNMLSFARKSDKAISSQDLGALLDQTVELLKTDYNMKKQYDFKQIKLVREYEEDAPSVPCEGSKLQQVFMNILKNGAEAMAETTDASAQPAFMLRVKDDGAWVRVEIEDNGPGMDEGIRRRIFEPFFTTKPAGKGTGLGLSVSYFIVTEDHGGEMRVVPAVGGGTCFVIRLPKGGSVIGDQ